MTKFGTYTGNDIASVNAFEGWFGAKQDHVLAYINNDSWGAFDSGTTWAINQYKGLSEPIIWSVPLTVWGTSLENVATGAQNSHFQSAANQILASRAGDSDPIYIRVGWEMNGSWMPWAAAGHEQAFIKAFQQEADVFHNTSSRFKIVWDTTNDGGNINPETVYPGDKYVDVIGTDTYYDPQWDGTDAGAAFQNEVSRPYGLQWLDDFAKAHGKPTAMSEWGVTGDNASAYVKGIAAWMTSHNMIYGNYWESTAGGYNGLLQNNQFPTTAATFKDTFKPAPAPVITPTPTTGAHTVSFKVAEDAYQGDAQFVVLVDGKQVGGTFTATTDKTSGQWQDVSLKTDLTPGDHTFAIKFLNDAWGGSSSADRNLYVGGFSLDGKAISTTVAPLYSTNDTASYKATVADALTVKVSGDAYQGTPHFVVTVDGKQIGDTMTTTASHVLGQTQDITLTGSFGVGSHEIAVKFLDDAYGGTAMTDRNLYVHQITLNGQTYTGDQADSWGTKIGTTTALMSTGAATFHTLGTDTLTFKVSEDAFKGDAQFMVKVNGVQVGNIETAHALHSNPMTQDTFVFSGHFGTNPDVSVTFLNDAYGGTAETDRNLYIHSVDLNGHTVAGTTIFSGEAHWHDWHL